MHPPRVFTSILNRERDRADRTGQEFSMAVFEVGNGKRNSDSAKNLVPILIRRIRSTDSIGWLEDGRICAALPHTGPEGAWKFVANVRNAYSGGVPPPDCSVYVYPSSGISGGGGIPPDRRPHGRNADSRPIGELGKPLLSRTPSWKRLIDIAGSLAGIVVLSPLFALVALFIKAVSPGPVLFRQERVGCLGETFTLWKFRTMHADSDTAVHRDYLRDLIHNGKEMTKLDQAEDRRIIPFGRLLRSTGIDELPQLINVLKGDMSLVGPRPCLRYEAQEYESWQMRRFDVTPGLTGLWQVSGKNRTTFTEMMRLDISYSKGRSFLLDLRIFLRTIPAIIRHVADLPAPHPVRSRVDTFALRAGSVVMSLVALYARRR